MPYPTRQRKAIRSRTMRVHREWSARKWKKAFCDDWHYSFLLAGIKAKLETMERYNMNLSYDANGPYYGHQIRLAIRMIEIIWDEGGRDDYGEFDEFIPKPESFTHYVNMRNRDRIPRHGGDGGDYFWSEAQELRFDKAWILLWKILSEKMMAWGD